MNVMAINYIVKNKTYKIWILMAMKWKLIAMNVTVKNDSYKISLLFKRY